AVGRAEPHHHAALGGRPAAAAGSADRREPAPLPRGRGAARGVDALVAQHDPYRASTGERGREDRRRRVRQVEELAHRQPRGGQPRLLEHGGHQPAVAAGDQPVQRTALEQSRRVAGDGTDQLVGLVAATAGEPLLRPPARGGAPLHVSAADLALDQPVAVGQRDGVATPTHEHQAEPGGRLGEPGQLLGGRGPVERRPRRELGGDGVAAGEEAAVDHGPVVALGEPREPARQPLDGDLDHAAHRGTPRARGGPTQRGTQRASAPAVAPLISAVTQMPAASEPIAAPADTTSGPAALPESASSRHTPRNWARSPGGAVSAPSVMITPEPMPLPNPSSIATPTSGPIVPVSGSSTSATPMTSIDGTATHSRPLTSITLPAG